MPLLFAVLSSHHLCLLLTGTEDYGLETTRRVCAPTAMLRASSIRAAEQHRLQLSPTARWREQRDIALLPQSTGHLYMDEHLAIEYAGAMARAWGPA